MKGIMVLILFFLNHTGWAAINIVAAENVYGSIAQEIGGSYVNVTSIINTPNGDPHLFSTAPSTAKAMLAADIIIYNGADYDPWIYPLLNMPAQNKQRTTLVIADLMHIKSGQNPHIWYLPQTMPTLAAKLVTTLQALDPSHQQDYARQWQRFNQSYRLLDAKISALHARYKNTNIIATEPVFNYMATSLGFIMHGLNFQISVMNDVPPTITDIKAFEDDINQHVVKLMIYNNQVSNPLTEKMLALAKSNHIPVVGVSEMMPPNDTYVQWMLMQLAAIEAALARSPD